MKGRLPTKLHTIRELRIAMKSIDMMLDHQLAS